MALFDLRWGYHLRYSSAAGVYFNGPKPDRLRRPQYSKPWARKARKPRRRLLATAVSNCNDYAGRAQYLGALRAALGEEFVNIGRCHHSLSAEDKAELERAGADKFIARGYFYLALENANCDGYVTEKLGRAMLAGVVPVVFDAPQSLAGGADATALPGYAPFLPPGTYVNLGGAYQERTYASNPRPLPLLSCCCTVESCSCNAEGRVCLNLSSAGSSTSR